MTTESQHAEGVPTFSNVGELLKHLELSDLEDLAGYFADDLDSYVTITDVSEGYDPPGIEILLTQYGRGIVEPFPISLDEIWQDLYDIEAECQVPDHLDALADDIESVEQVAVLVELDEEVFNPAVLDAIGRRMTSSGLLVQYVHTLCYPYRRRIRGSATVDEWLVSRVFKHCPGVRVSLRGDRSMTLDQVRQLDDSYPMIDVGMEDSPQDARRSGR